MEARAKLRSFKRRRAVQVKKLCPKLERNASLRKVSSILRKSEGARSAEERAVLASMADEVREAQRRLVRRQRDLERCREREDDASTLRAKCDQLADAIRNATHLVVYTGAGISTAADIPDYRGPHGVWTMLQQGKQLAKVDISRAQPTYTHMALRELHARGRLKFVVSQNCDGLHLRAGLPRHALAEVHGNMYIEQCGACSPPAPYWRLFDTTERTARYCHQTARICHYCAAPLLDTIVHFGERGSAAWPLNWAGALRHAAAADLVLCLGSSLKVLRKYPWLWNMQRPAEKRPPLFIVNLQWTPKDHTATLKINGKCDKVMSLIMRRLGIKVRPYDKRLDPIFAHATPLSPRELHTTRKPMLKMNEGSYVTHFQNDDDSDSDDDLPLSELKVTKPNKDIISIVDSHSVSKLKENGKIAKCELGNNFKNTDLISQLTIDIKDENDLPLSKLKLLKQLKSEVKQEPALQTKCSPVKFLYPNNDSSKTDIEESHIKLDQKVVDATKLEKRNSVQNSDDEENLTKEITVKESLESTSKEFMPQQTEDLYPITTAKTNIIDSEFIEKQNLDKSSKMKDSEKNDKQGTKDVHDNNSHIEISQDLISLQNQDCLTKDKKSLIDKDNVQDEISCMKCNSIDENLLGNESNNKICKCDDNRYKSLKYDRDKENLHCFQVNMMANAVTIMLLAKHSYENNLNTGQKLKRKQMLSDEISTPLKQDMKLSLPNTSSHSRTNPSITEESIRFDERIKSIDSVSIKSIDSVSDSVSEETETMPPIKKNEEPLLMNEKFVLNEESTQEMRNIRKNEPNDNEDEQLNVDGKFTSKLSSSSQCADSKNILDDERVIDTCVNEEYTNKNSFNVTIINGSIVKPVIHAGANGLKGTPSFSEVNNCMERICSLEEKEFGDLQSSISKNKNSHQTNEYKKPESDQKISMKAEHCLKIPENFSKISNKIQLLSPHKQNNFSDIIDYKSANESKLQSSDMLINLLNKPAAPFTNNLVANNKNSAEAKTNGYADKVFESNGPAEQFEDLENVLEYSIVSKSIGTEPISKTYKKPNGALDVDTESLGSKLNLDDNLQLNTCKTVNKVPPNIPKLISLRDFRRYKENEQIFKNTNGYKNGIAKNDLSTDEAVNNLQLRNSAKDIDKLKKIDASLARIANKSNIDDEAKLAAECGELARAIIRHTVLVCRAQTRLLYSGLHSIIGPNSLIQCANATPITRTKYRSRNARKRKRSPECKFCAEHYRTSRCAFYRPHNSDDRVEKRVNGKLVMCGCCGDTSSEDESEKSDNDKTIKSEDKMTKAKEESNDIKTEKDVKLFQPANKVLHSDDDLVQQPGWFGKGYRKGRRRR